MTTPPSAAGSQLGQSTNYRDDYDVSRLYPIPRAAHRDRLPASARAPFGVDLWTAWELSWLNPGGKPQVAVGEITVPADSPCLIESKSLKLYLNGYIQTVLADMNAVQARIADDLSAAAGAAVDVRLAPLERVAAPQPLPGICIDDSEVVLSHYAPPDATLLRSGDAVVDERLHSHLFKSNCPVTGQPDWASLLIDYRGRCLDRAGLLAYLTSFRQHADFHEHCVERIYADLWQHLQPQRLCVLARYTRRGGLDINPLRSSEAASLARLGGRVARQ